MFVYIHLSSAPNAEIEEAAGIYRGLLGNSNLLPTLAKDSEYFLQL